MQKCNELRSVEEMMDLSSIVLYGAGNICRKILSNLFEAGKINSVTKIVISSSDGKCAGTLKWKKTLYGIDVEEYDTGLVSDDQLIVIATTAYKKEIFERLTADGKKNVLCLSSDFESKLDIFLRQMHIKQTEQMHRKIAEDYKDSLQPSDHDIAFITPPYWDMYAPFSAVPCLKAWLKKNGYRTAQLDMGIICIRYAMQKSGKPVMDYLLSEAYYNAVIKKYRNNKYHSYQSYYEEMDFLRESRWDIDQIKAEYKSFSYEKKCVADEFYERIYSRDAADIRFDTCVSIDGAVQKADLTSLYASFEDARVSRFFRKLPGVIGISITSASQFIPGCAIARLIHEIKPETKVIFGGSCADIFVNSDYKNKTDIYRYFDYVIVGEGETAILKLLESMQGGDVEDIPNLAYAEDGKLKIKNVQIEDVHELPPPDYDDLDLSLYLSPEIILPYQSSRGCHYGHCAFCNHDEKYRHNYRSKQMKKAVEDMVFLSQKYDAHCFQFVDEAIRPDCFREMVDEMDKNDGFHDITWFFYSRVSRQYDEELLRKAYKNGCRMVMFGVETFNQRLLTFIKKGISAETSRYCLKAFHDNKIKTYAWMMTNLPSETLEEVHEDLGELKAMMPYIDAFYAGAFMLVKNSDMYKNLADYNIVEINDEDPCRFQSHYDGEIIDKEEMLRFASEYRMFQLEVFLTGNRYTLFFG